MNFILRFLPVIIPFPVGLFILSHPIGKLMWATLGLLFLLKLSSLIRNRQLSLALPKGMGWFCFLFAWPGMRPESFSRRAVTETSVGREFVSGFVFLILGVLLQLGLVLSWETLHVTLRLYLGLFSFLLLIHFGLSSILFALYRLSGFSVEPLFLDPFRSSSLSEFWGQRWNLAFVDMDKRLFFPLFPKQFSKSLKVFGIFLVSGILHEVGISYPAGGGWGLPLMYFVIHGGLTLIEPSIPLLSKYSLVRRLWVWIALLAPLPLLFHSAFLNTFVKPYFEFASVTLASISLSEVIYWAILACGAGHFLILTASFQVPKKLAWKTEFSRLGRFNQKIFWTYGGYIVFCIVAFAMVDLFNARGLMDNHPSTTAIALFIALFWSVRVIVDFGYFKHDDWPKGDLFVIGHTCLTALFSFLALTHWGVVAWHWTNA